MCTSIYNTKKIKIVSAECGRGKTYATCSHIARNTKLKNHLIVQPSSQLLEQTQKDLKEEFSIESTLIDGKGSVKRVVQYLNECKKKGEVLLINWECYNKLPEHFIDNLQKWWGIFIDEIPQIDTFHPFNLLENKGLFSDYFEIQKSVNEVLSLVVAKDEKKLKELINAKNPLYSKRLINLFRKIASPYYDVFVNAYDFHKTDEKSNIYFISMLNPVLFQGVTLLGANIETNMLSMWFNNYHGFGFVDDKDIINGLLPKQDFTGRLNIQYLTKKSNAKNFKKRFMSDGSTFNEVMHKLVQNEFKDEPYIFIDNKDVTTSFEFDDNVNRISVIAKGFNNYQHIHNIAFLPALNRKALQIMMLYQLGIDDTCIKYSTGYEALYQAIMRTILRNRKSKKVVKVIVVSKDEALFLYSFFGGNQKVKRVSRLFEYERYEPLNPTERTNNYKFKKIQQTLLSIGDICFEDILKDKHQNEYDSSYSSKNNSSQNDAYNNQINKPINEKSLLDFVTLHAYFESDSNIVNMDFMELKKYLEKSSKVTTDDKESQPLINSSIFSHQGYWQRTNENFIQSNMLILDFDDGDISIEDFEKIFNDDAGRGQKRSFIICNSYSASDATPNKFRVFMPFSRPVTSIGDYQSIFDSVLARLVHLGYTMDSMALDIKSRSPVQSYYMPCTNREHKRYAYFKVYGFKSKRELKQRSLDVDSILRTALKPVQNNVVVPVNFSKNQTGVDLKITQIRQKYLEVPKGVGQRNSAFFEAGLALSNYKNTYHLEHELIELADGDKKRLGQIKSVLNSVKKYNTKMVA